MSYNDQYQRKRGFSDNVNLVQGPNYPYGEPSGRSRWHPRSWGVKTKIGVAVGILIVIVAIIVGAVLGTRANRYPTYSKLNYTIKDTYQGANFFDMFDYYTGYDPSQGFVHYVDSVGSNELPLNITSATSKSAILRVDTSEQNASTGRKSARITSKSQYDDGLFVFDVLHAPYGCGTWPALWLSGPVATWPNDGEIDIYETVNAAVDGNQVTLHTTDGCDMNVKRVESGNVLSTNCLNSTNENAGCGVQGPTASGGQAFNSNGGGVYATELRSDGIRTWFFPRSSIPADITAGKSPDPSSWGTAMADFPNTDCSIGNHFKNQSIIANIDLCGSWAGAQAIYSQQDGCPGQCTDLVATNATAFVNAYFEFASFKVYQTA